MSVDVGEGLSEDALAENTEAKSGNEGELEYLGSLMGLVEFADEKTLWKIRNELDKVRSRVTNAILFIQNERKGNPPR